ncbi:winged helix-turn-helix transcriptional regulator [Berryella wangjianweii]|uniref:Winged helix-turn-helix transcriptional regulator n=2 Tax=Berryella wangjianweii TaxID=2734634 RepID=A0A6M8JBF6_9ACTN|nr:winged helix-turn-helix transcriptional regulator [Eggerthellaceae bacterium zg-997]QKF08052.1 winged helix-turn-helix transcriptional regulator [Berryella wangjianweii]
MNSCSYVLFLQGVAMTEPPIESHLLIDPNLPEGMPEEELLYELADLFKVFSDTTRIKILYTLMERERYVAEIAEAIGATQSAVSHQLRILKQAHLVRFQRDGKNITYSLADDHVNAMLLVGLTHICE